MLLRKKILILVIILLLALPISYAQVCEVGKIKQVLRKILYIYFTEPGSMPLTVNEAKDMLIFYLSISSQNLSVDCSVLGANSNRAIFEVINLGDALPEKIPACADGTKYGECSKFRPAYCYAGALYQKCDLCGCPANSVCGKSKKCEPLAQNITCFNDIDCGQSTFIGDYYCTNNYIAKNYINYTCINSGTTSSRCDASNSTVYLTYCNPNLNQACVNGQSTCKTTINDSAPTVAISVIPTTAAQGQFFNVTVTGTDDIGLAAIWWWATNTTDTELNKAHWYNCNGARVCTYSWLASTNAVGSITLGANSRDTSYPVAGQPHQASEGQGIAYATITVTGAVQNLTGLPDLVVINLGAYTGTTSTDILISAIILNNGTGPAQNTCDGLYIETLNARGFCGGPALMPGQTKSMSSAFALPVPGTFKVRADTDYGQWVNESNENNNVVWSTITVTSPYTAEYSKANTDLTVTDINVQLPTSSSSADVKVTTKNLGSLATGQYWILTKVTHMDTGKITNVQRLAPVVQPGGTYTTSHGSVGIAEYGTYKVEAFVDNSNYIPEFDENNNYLAVTMAYGNVTQANVTTQTNRSLQVLIPNGGEIWYYNVTNNIYYNSAGVYSLGLQLLKGTQVVNSIAPINIAPTTTSFPSYNNRDIGYYLNPNIYPVVGEGSDYKIRLYDYDNPQTSDESNAPFSLFLNNKSNQTTTNQTATNQTSCTDSDGGNNIYVKGTMSVRSCPTCFLVNTNDSCSSGPSGQYVTEGWCSNGIGYQASYLCANGCFDGACAATNQTNQTTSLPDLIVSNITFVPPNPTASDYIKALVTVKNIGTATAGSSVASLDFHSQYKYTVTIGINSLASGASYTADMSTVYGWPGNSFSAGTYMFNATADAFNSVSESNKNNNLMTKSLTVSSAAANQTTLTSQCKVIDFEDDPQVGSDITWNPDYGTEPSSIAAHRDWLGLKGLNITGTPNGFVWSTKKSGDLGMTGVIIGFASPDFSEYAGLSDNEQLAFHLLNSSPKSVQIGLTASPSTSPSINNVASTVVADAYDAANNLVGSTTKSFTGVTNGIYTPAKINVTASTPSIAKIALRTTQYPYDGIYVEDITSCT